MCFLLEKFTGNKRNRARKQNYRVLQHTKKIAANNCSICGHFTFSNCVGVQHSSSVPVETVFYSRYKRDCSPPFQHHQISRNLRNKAASSLLTKPREMAAESTSTSVYQTSLDERFTFIRQAGKGTYGTTWIALDKETNSKVAIKAINKNTTNRTSFKKELKYSKHLSKHENIIKTHDTAFETKTCYVMVQDYAPGGDLFDAIEPEVGLEASKARVYFGQIAKALEFMHGKKLVHRDLKPENVVLGDDEGTFIKLIDFGMTLRTGTHVSRVCGSIPYTPPEICNAKDEVGFFVEPSCDVWSAGVLLFCMLTGSFPWEQATLSDPNFSDFVQWQTGKGRVPHMWRSFSPQLLELFSKLLALDPKDRCKINEVHKYLKEPWYNTEIYSSSTSTSTRYQPNTAGYSQSCYEVDQFMDSYKASPSQCGLSLLPQFGANHFQSAAVLCS